MATGSAATKRHEALQRLAKANYSTGTGPGARCSNCQAVTKHPGIFGVSRNDRWCKTHDAGVKTHGSCQAHAKAEG